MAKINSKQSKLSDLTLKRLMEAMGEFVHNPYGFVLFAFPWGEGLLSEETGPDTWQVDILKELGAGSLSVEKALRIAVASGHGIGKTALVAWIILWFICTRPHPQIVVTANTKAQLDNKTWRELSKWHKLSIMEPLLEWTATKFYMKSDPGTWFAASTPWSETNSEAFAGTHEKHVLIVMDEASGIPDKIHEVATGAMTTPGAMWIAFGNPTQNTGWFRECFREQQHRWVTRQIDSRTAKMANKEEIQKWIDDFGEDSDYIRVRVRGVFPRESSTQLISGEVVTDAMLRTATGYEDQAKVMGVDVAREGDDQSVILTRQGNKVWPLRKYRIPDLMELVGKVIEAYNEDKPDQIFVDAVGLGAGVYDRLKQLNYPVIPVMSGAKPSGFGTSVGITASNNQTRYLNLRAEIWYKMKQWLSEEAVDLPDDPELRTALCSVQYAFDNRDRFRLESKRDMKRRGLDSPDEGDALAFTHTIDVMPKNRGRSSSSNPRRGGSWMAM